MFGITKKETTFANPNGRVGALAQSVEQRTENPCVAGSIPAGTTTRKASEKSGAFCFYTFLVIQACILDINIHRCVS